MLIFILVEKNIVLFTGKKYSFVEIPGEKMTKNGEKVCADGLSCIYKKK